MVDVVDISDSCRACLAKMNGDEDAHSFASPGVRELFVKCTGITIPLLDPLPQQICSACFGKCNEWREFETLSQSTNHRLQREIVIEIPEASWDSDYKEKRSDEKIPVVVLERLEEAIANDQSTTVIVIECPICRVDLPDLPVSVRQHLKGHVSEMNPKCPICRKKFMTHESGVRHILAAHRNQPVTERSASNSCTSEGDSPFDTLQSENTSSDEQSMALSSNSELSSSSSEERVSKPIAYKYRELKKKLFPCLPCGLCFKRRSLLARHRLTLSHRRKQRSTASAKGSTDSYSMECPCCELRFKEARNVANHILRSHRSHAPISGVVQIICEHFTCPLCSEHHSENFEAFKNHLFDIHATTSEEEPISCAKCLLNFATGKDLLDHLTSLHLGCIFKCNACKFQDPTPSRTIMHLNEVHNIDIKLCPECGKWKRSLVAHLKTHIPNECTVCSKVFNSERTLRLHFLLHLPHICEICDGKFTSKRNLIIHIERTHLNPSVGARHPEI